MTTQRLVGLNVLGVCCFLLAAATASIALLIPFGPRVLRSLDAPVDGPLALRLFTTLMAAGSALVIGLAGRGLMKREGWARTLVMFVTGAQAIRPALRLLAGSPNLALDVGAVLLAAAILVYLNLPTVRLAFRGTRS